MANYVHGRPVELMHFATASPSHEMQVLKDLCSLHQLLYILPASRLVARGILSPSPDPDSMRQAVALFERSPPTDLTPAALTSIRADLSCVAALMKAQDLLVSGDAHIAQYRARMQSLVSQQAEMEPVRVELAQSQVRTIITL